MDMENMAWEGQYNVLYMCGTEHLLNITCATTICSSLLPHACSNCNPVHYWHVLHGNGPKVTGTPGWI